MTSASQEALEKHSVLPLNSDCKVQVGRNGKKETFREYWLKMAIAGPQATTVYVGLNYFRSLKFKFFLGHTPTSRVQVQSKE